MPEPRVSARYPFGQWCPKMMREHLCAQATFAPDDTTRDAFSNLIRVLDLHRPIGPDGKHDNRHTPTCGCDDKDGDR